MRQFVIPEIFFKYIAERGKLYSRIWFYWLSEFADVIFETDFIEKQTETLNKWSSESEIREIYEFGIQLLQQDFKIVENKKVKKSFTKEEIVFSQEVISYLNEKTGTNFSKKGANVELIINLKRQGYLIEDFLKVIDKKTSDWKGTDWQKYLRPITLFSKQKFDNYLNENNDKSPNNFKKFAESIAKAQFISFRSK